MAVADAPPVTQLGDFRILREVGRGGMGVVYEAEQVSLGRRVALKVLPATVFRDPVKRRRFEREAQAAAQLHHTNIVPVFGVGEHDGTPYYVMQFIPGPGAGRRHRRTRPVASRRSHPRPDPAAGRRAGGPERRTRPLPPGGGRRGNRGLERPGRPTPRRRPSAGGVTPDPAPLSRPDRGSSASLSTSGVHLPGQSGSGVGGSAGKKTTYWESVARIGVQVAEALAYAHKQGVLHRDIKPANLLLDLDGIVWVTDFGLAKADDSDDLTHTGDLLGTLRYMPPEAFEGKSDARSDVYALGLTLYELVALRPAYEERDRNKLVKQVTTGDPPRLRKLRQDAPRDLVTIVEKAIDKDPARRYQTAGALADDLQRFLDDRPITARRATELERLWMWARRRPATAGLVAALFLCLLAGSVVSTVFAVRADGFARDAELREKDATVARDAPGGTRRAEAARDEAKQTRNAAARQAAGLLLDRGIEDARGGEPARALHLFVQALRTLPADDPEAAPLERVIRANLSAWAETVPALEHIWPGGVRIRRRRLHPRRRSDRPGRREGRGPVLPDRHRPAGRPADQGPRRAGCADGVRARRPEPLGRVARPREGRRTGGPFTGSTRRRVARSSRRSRAPGRSCASPSPRTGGTSSGRSRGCTRTTGVAKRTRIEPASGERRRSWCGRRRRAGSSGRWTVNAESDYATANAWPDAYLSLSPDGKSVTAWVERGANRFEGMTFTVEGNEPPIRRELPAVGSGAPWKLHFENNMRTGLAIKDDQLHRWSATEPGVLGPGVPTPFRSMHYGPSADGRSVISPVDGRVFDTGAWPPRPSGVRFAHPGWQRSADAWTEQSPDGRFAATWIWQPESDAATLAAPPAPQPARAPARRIGPATGTHGLLPRRPVRPARDECGPLVASAGLAYSGAMTSITSGSWT